jgi:predicted ATPase/transcriptional regulator with XRE-family HTH domain
VSNLIPYRREKKCLPDELLVMYRQRSGWTQVQLAEQLALKTTKMLQLWENGYQLPTAPRLKKLIELYYRQNVFTPGKETLEVRELWASVKDAFDTRSETYQTYPIFDELWFGLLMPEADAPKIAAPSPSTESLPLHLTRPNNLPATLLPLVGREPELARLSEMFEVGQSRLVTLTGTGGIGKTRLALQLAHRLLGKFEHGVFWVELAAIYDAGLVLPAIARALGLKEDGDLSQNLRAHLRERQLLLVLDNFEQVVTAAELLTALLAGAPGLKLLVTSRIVLRLYGEQEFSVPPLQLPQNAPDTDFLAQSEAVQLLVERARLVRPDFILTATNAPAIAGICIRLEGLPLALELASGWLKLFSPHDLLQRLEESAFGRLKTLTTGARNLTERQQTLRNTIEWSYRLLEPDLQVLFGRLAVFRGNSPFEALETVCSTPDEPFLMQLQTLVDHNLLRVIAPADNEDELHYEMLETIREYALEKLSESTEAEIIRARHCDYYLELLERAQVGFQTEQQLSWLNRLERNHPNLRAALGWALAEPSRLDKALRLGIILAVFWHMRGHLNEGRQWLRLILGRAKEADSDPAMRARLLNNAALLAGRQNDSAEAAALLETALELWRGLQDYANVSRALNNLGVIAFQRGELTRATELYEECLGFKRNLGEPRGLAVVLNNLGEIYQRQGNLSGAQTLYEESLALLKQLGDSPNIGIAVLNLGKVALARQDFGAATELLTDSLQKLLDVGDKFNLADNLESLAELAAHDNIAQWLWVVRLYGTAAAVRQEIAAPLSAQQQEVHNTSLALAQSHLPAQRRDTPDSDLAQLIAELVADASLWQ